MLGPIIFLNGASIFIKIYEVGPNIENIVDRSLVSDCTQTIFISSILLAAYWIVINIDI